MCRIETPSIRRKKIVGLFLVQLNFNKRIWAERHELESSEFGWRFTHQPMLFLTPSKTSALPLASYTPQSAPVVLDALDSDGERHKFSSRPPLRLLVCPFPPPSPPHHSRFSYINYCKKTVYPVIYIFLPNQPTHGENLKSTEPCNTFALNSPNSKDFTYYSTVFFLVTINWKYKKIPI